MSETEVAYFKTLLDIQCCHRLWCYYLLVTLEQGIEEISYCNTAPTLPNCVSSCCLFSGMSLIVMCFKELNVFRSKLPLVTSDFAPHHLHFVQLWLAVHLYNCSYFLNAYMWENICAFIHAYQCIT